ncbi:MAG: MATE family efflux transporter, partial [Clostridia bacterium]|nr:MATE family efflux transporter [Clostridia bacterium]
MTKDLTVGKPLKTILLFTLPIFIGNVFQQLYSMIDAIIVGRTISNDALAGVGATGAISFLVIGFVQGLTAGFAVKTSQLFGAKDEDGVRRSIASSILLCLILSVIVTAVSVATTMPLLKVMRTDA